MNKSTASPNRYRLMKHKQAFYYISWDFDLSVMLTIRFCELIQDTALRDSCTPTVR